MVYGSVGCVCRCVCARACGGWGDWLRKASHSRHPDTVSLQADHPELADDTDDETENKPEPFVSIMVEPTDPTGLP